MGGKLTINITFPVKLKKNTTNMFIMIQYVYQHRINGTHTFYRLDRHDNIAGDESSGQQTTSIIE
jgi:hypothetical protein